MISIFEGDDVDRGHLVTHTGRVDGLRDLDEELLVPLSVLASD